eukprot:m.306849 g.306849  ORF g.306849 m.306849 type:complete len:57 (+) comp41642_c0_seq1:1532-1702(+)
MAISPDGEVVGHVNANELLDLAETEEITRLYTDTTSVAYHKFLENGLKKWKEMQLK